MPNTKSAAKRLRQNERRRIHNKSIKSALKTQIKKVLNALREGNIEDAENQYRVAAKRLDQAGAKGVIHPNTAARKKSRIQNAIKKVKAQGAA